VELGVQGKGKWNTELDERHNNKQSGRDKRTVKTIGEKGGVPDVVDGELPQERRINQVELLERGSAQPGSVRRRNPCT